MSRMTYCLCLVIAFLSYGGHPTEYPKDYFQPPVTGPLRLSGTFGELRPNHFHGGIDIKGTVGTPIYAAAEGFVSKIVIAPDSYGNHLYIQHPNGYTTLYAHLESFAPAIQQFVREKQRLAETFELTFVPSAGQFRVDSGTRIGSMGNTGHSFGPHLHFEIRETATDKPHNPLLFGYKVADTVPPRLHEVKIYETDLQGNTRSTRILPLVFKNGKYRVSADTVVVNSEQLGLAIKAYDHMDGVPNWNGIYALELSSGDERLYGFKLDAIGRTESRFLNAHIDYLEQKYRGSYFHRCFKLPGNMLSIYYPDKTGRIALSPGEVKKLDLVVRDVAGNISTLELFVRRASGESIFPSVYVPYQFFWPYNHRNRIEDYQIYIDIPSGTFYENAFIRYQVKSQTSGQYSDLHSFQPEDIPLHQSFLLGLRAENIPQKIREKAFIGQVSKGSVTNWGGHWQDDGMIVAAVRNLGHFCILADTVPPVIQAERFTSDMRRYTSMSFKISDNISASPNLPNLRFKGFIDGKWVLFTYDEKNRRIQYIFEDDLSKGAHQLKIEVVDAMGNTAVFERAFLR
jgi:hypothetical protein